MKKCFLIVVLVIIVVYQCAMICFAEESTEKINEVKVDVETEIAIESNTESRETIVNDESAYTYHTLFTRLWEYCVEHKTELIAIAGDVALFILTIFVKLKNDKKTTLVAQTVKSIKGDTAGTSSSQASVVSVVNDMVDGYNALKDSYDKYGATEDDRNRIVGALVAQNTAILEILTTVYSNSKNLPTGVKDLVNIKYANCLKSLDNDEALKAIVTAVRENIGYVSCENVDKAVKLEE